MNRDMTAAERREHWAQHYEGDPDWNCRPWLLVFVDASFGYLELIFGPVVVDRPLVSVLQGASPGAFDKVAGPSWREMLGNGGPRICASWCFTKLFRQLGLYGRYGVTDADIPLGERDAHIDRLIEAGVAFLEDSPIQQLAKKTDNRRFTRPVDRVVRVAWNRKTLDDHGGHVRGFLEPSAMAVLGGVSDGRLRNPMSEGRMFQVEEGLIGSESALSWLKGRPMFWDHTDSG